LGGITALNLSGFSCRALLPALVASLILAVPAAAQTPAAIELLRLDSKIPLGPVRGRIDHMAIDVPHRRLFVAELGNDSLGVVDLAARKTIRTIGGLAEPQGVGYAPSVDTIYVANARDGSVRLFRGADYTDAGRIELGSDADNVRLDVDVDRALIGYGAGAIAAIDTAQHKEIGHFRLPAHPEGFQIGGEPKKVFVNVPGAHGVLVLDGTAGAQTAKWTLTEGANFPMALDAANGRVLVVSRNPPRLIVFAEDGSSIAKSDTCGDSDDLFVDPKRKRVYVSCGAGSIDVFAEQDSTYRRIARIATVGGARTSLFVPDLDLFLLAVRATSSEPASIWVFKPQP
jgi:DNA-binding beta-propeller fold protein YncE